MRMNKLFCLQRLEDRCLLAVTLPAKPSGLSAIAQAFNKVQLKWTDNSTNESGFKVERSKDGLTFSKITQTQANITAYTDSSTTAATTFIYRVRATNSAGDSMSSAVVSVTTPASTGVGSTPTATTPTPFSGTAISLPGTIQAENFDNGGANVGFSDTDPENKGGAYRTTAVDVVNTTDSSKYAVGYIRAGEWLSYCVDVKSAGNYIFDLRIAAGGAGGSYHLESNKVNLSGSISINPTGSWSTWSVLSTKPIALKSGKQVLRLVFDSAKKTGADIATVNFLTVKSASTGVGSTPPTTEAPRLAATAIAANQVSLAWDDLSTAETGYRVERRLAGTTTFTVLATVRANVTRFADITVTAERDYEYQVRPVTGTVAGTPTVIAAATTPVAGGFAWNRGTSSVVGRYEAAGAMINGKLYVLGGYIDQDIHATARCDVYDPASNQWKRLGDMPEILTHSGQAVDGSLLWVAGGFVGDHPGSATKSVWKYDTTNDAWTRGPDLPLPRGSGALAIRGRNLHFMGGLPGAGSKATAEYGNHWILNLDNLSAGWKAVAAMPNPRGHFSAVALGGKVYAIGGQHLWDEETGVEDDVHRYDPLTNKWTTVAPLPKSLSHTTASTFTYKGKIIVVGGATDFFETSSDVYSYDPAANKWTSIARLPSPRLTPVAGVFGNQLVVTTGSGGYLYANKDTWWGVLF